MAAPTLTGLTTTATFDENTVNKTSQRIDADVTFGDVDGDFNGGTLVVSGLLAEDTVSILSGLIISLSSGVVYYDADGAGGAAAIAIGTAAGGAGSTFTVTFNASATSVIIDALIQNLTYANSSNTPTASRELIINVTDAGGVDLGTTRTGAANPLDGFDVGGQSSPTFVDLDNDGDLDMVAGEIEGTLRGFANNNGDDGYTELTGAANPFGGIDTVRTSHPTFTDLDGDGDLDLVSGGYHGNIQLFDKNNGDNGYTELTGGANPFSSINTGYLSVPIFTDLDGDGDLDLVVAGVHGTLVVFDNNNGDNGYTALTGGANPLSFDLGRDVAAAFADVDGDGDQDMVIGDEFGVIRVLDNNDANAGFTELTGAANPFRSVTVGLYSTPTFVDIDGDGDQDLIVGAFDGTFTYVQNDPRRGALVTVNVTDQNDLTTATGLPTDVTVVEDVASNLDLSAVTLADVDTTGSITVVLTATAGAMTASSGGSVTVTNSGTGAITLSGTAANIDTFLNTASNIQYTGALNANGNDAATVTVTADDGSGAVTLGVVNIDITAVDDPMTLTGLSPSITFAENTVNATPQLLDATVAFSDPDAGFNGGSLTVSGLLAQDKVSILSGATISLSSGTVYYDADGAGGAAAVSIGAATGGAGATFTVTFNASATSASIDALIENLTYANSSNTPTASRTLSIDVLDSVGGGLGVLVGPDSLTAVSGAGNPFNGFTGFITSRPTLADVDGDGDLDLVVGDHFGQFHMFANSGGVFTQLAGGANPFAAINLSYRGTPSFVDLDGDGDLDAVFGESAGSGALSTFLNGTHGASGAFTLATGGDDPFSSFSFTDHRAPTFVDLDGDGDKDLVVGDLSAARVRYFSNTGGVFTEQTGGTNPLNGVAVGSRPVITFADLDHDGDSDMLVGQNDGRSATGRIPARRRRRPSLNEPGAVIRSTASMSAVSPAACSVTLMATETSISCRACTAVASPSSGARRLSPASRSIRPSRSTSPPRTKSPATAMMS